MTTCVRPNCTNKGRESYRGLCHKHARATGVVTPTVDHSTAAAHIHRLKALGWRYSQIADAAGVSPDTLTNYATGRYRSGRRSVIARILAIPLAPPAITPTGVARRLQGLMALGWRSDELADALGVTRTTIYSLTRGVSPHPKSPTMAPRIAEFAEEHGYTYRREPTIFTRARAWVPIAAWDEIDNPAAKPAPSELPDRVPFTYHTLAALQLMCDELGEVTTICRLGTTRNQLTRWLNPNRKQHRIDTRVAQRLFAYADAHAAKKGPQHVARASA
ncbi:Helix-turn-helix protein [Corynebacterium heidelbergense]|uniref:helix-turn-helix transcriptional regulator n=1 Tax=Corynebacterium heidelbergense TaxID=2055947 RepID=UPI0023583D34|nr:helix-turn-helix transcriptional regulator [Corynebacterium heidelbergense]WCZ37005.1 Helix-turn-helix protein [Corynebacterium heidelbergense]